MDSLQVLALIEELEASLPVTEWTLDGLRPWPLFRIDLAFSLDAYLVGHTPPPPVGAWTDRLRTARGLLAAAPQQARALLRDRAHEARLAPADAALLAMSTARRFKRQGRWYCSFSDPILDRLEEAGLRGVVLEFSPGGEQRLPRYRPSRRIQAWLDAQRWARPLDARRAGAVAALPGFSAVQALVRARSGGWAPDPRAWAKKLGQLRRMGGLFDRLLRRVTPRVGLTYGWYDPEGMAFGLACARRGVPVVDVQHGVQGPAHVGYARWRLPPGGYELLPDLFWTWEEEDARGIRAWAGEGRHRALAVGNLTVEAFLRDPDLADLEPLPPRSGGGLEVLVALSGRELPRLVVEAILRSPSTWRWWVRVHPAQRATLGEIERRLEGRERVEVRRATDLPLYALLARVDVVLTEVSSAIIEAAAFGKRAVICHPVGAELHAARVERGQAAVALEVGPVLAALERMAAPGAPPAGGDPRGFARLLELVRAATPHAQSV